MNPINFASALLLDAKSGVKERAAAAKAELVTLVESLRAFEVDHLEPEVKALKASVLADVEKVLPKAK